MKRHTFLWLGVAFIACSCSKPPPKVEWAKPQDWVADKLYEEYMRDIAKGDLRFKGKAIIIDGGIWSQKDAPDNYIAVGLTYNGNTREGIRACFPGAIRFPSNERFFLQGICMGVKNDIIILEKCQVIGLGGWNSGEN